LTSLGCKPFSTALWIARFQLYLKIRVVLIFVFVECDNVHFNKLPSDNWPSIARPSFFEGIDGPAGLSGGEPESGKTPPARFSQILNQKDLHKFYHAR
jgi:hypothetical protein